MAFKKRGHVCSDKAMLIFFHHVTWPCLPRNGIKTIDTAGTTKSWVKLVQCPVHISVWQKPGSPSRVPKSWWFQWFQRIYPRTWSFSPLIYPKKMVILLVSDRFHRITEPDFSETDPCHDGVKHQRTSKWTCLEQRKMEMFTAKPWDFTWNYPEYMGILMGWKMMELDLGNLIGTMVKSPPDLRYEPLKK